MKYYWTNITVTIILTTIILDFYFCPFLVGFANARRRTIPTDKLHTPANGQKITKAVAWIFLSVLIGAQKQGTHTSIISPRANLFLSLFYLKI